MDFMYEIAGVGKYIKTNIYDVKQEQYINEADEDTLIIIFSNSGQYIYENGMKPLISPGPSSAKRRAGSP